ncbi:hypothetical protein DTO166G4_7798 [Paecilomyces variotii]|uniref:non-specific serine/threonine protein kinase n=1 Tax=Byssochlamys spectabilis TaxID=264951 RepID=A0A443HIQ0_BYSSP|nr:putative serine/threonine protein kinase [Paecilomyces variotii]KAJ9197546.1 hypothetical protein DTO164E3_5688 [Paecilomyces variotii]KAJ9210573.1 hypothetical protein DTO166G4_7798 [Paecilomyces variotii]KAJ9220780.1 hypothetical protein DTO169C6_6865 [Paecilomyces variotii]KAJ9230753.1 hypothetical protein DTO166G5_7136 [Paecilomyces variotii]KAJ9232070.1 hypothetical protein DTO169E5_7710 [Paecilomyces variotii]
MDGDLSLSQSLGGLRIANPDDSSLHSSDDAVTTGLDTQDPLETGSYTDTIASQQHHGSSVSLPPPSGNIQSSPPANDDARSYDQRLQNRSSVFYNQQELQQYQPSQYQSSIPQHPSSQPSSRPMSSFYAQPSINGSSSSATAREGSYRIRTDSGASSVSDKLARADSRSSGAALQAGVPARDNTHSERSYKQAQYLSGNGPLPPRQGSRPFPYNSGTPQVSSSPYGLEGGPLSSSEEWQDRGAAVGVRQETGPDGKPVTRYIKKGVRDFSFGQTLGEGSYSTVVLATDRQTLNEYAIKILDKRHIIKEKKVKYVNIEKDTLNRLTDHPGIVRLYYTFQDERSLYFVLDLCKGGELLGVLKRMSTFDEECTRFYGAQILDTVDYMHKRGVIHRDLKPENILLDDQMHTKVTDFGTAKILKGKRRPDDSQNGMPPIDAGDVAGEERASSFVGTAEYVSPELLTDKSACKASDLWAFGCIIFQLLAGRPPFKAANEYLTFQKIVNLEYEFPSGFPAVGRDLVERLLVLDPARRLPMEHIKNHEFFRGVTWGRGLWKQKAPRLKPYIPPPREPIKLNGGGDDDSFPPSINTAPPASRALPRVITELPPPTQLDIEWSPVLTKSNERILKLGNLFVSSSPAPHSPSSKNGHGENDAAKKFSRFFGGSTTKKRQRLVMITTSARIVIAAAGGEEKKAKVEISLLAPGTHYRSTNDSKGFSSWVVDTREKHFVFEEPKPSSSSVATSALATQEWLDTLDRAKEIALSQQGGGGYSGDDAFRELSSGLSSHANTLDRTSEFQTDGAAPTRNTLVKHQGTDSDSVKGKKRFSRRHSKNGLAAVF